MILVLIALWLWSWFNYLPDQAVSTMESLREAASRQIDNWIWVSEPVQVINEPYIITPMTDTMSGDMIDEEVLSGEVMSGDTTTGMISAWRSADQEEDPAMMDESIWDQIDTGDIIEPTTTTEIEPIINESEDLTITPSTDEVMSITIGWQTITVDGTPDEDIIINGKWYRVIVQKK